MARAEGHIYYNGFFAYSQLDKKTNDNVQYYQTPVLIGNFTTLSYFQTHAETPISTELSSGNGYSLAYRTFVYKASDYIQRTDYLTEDILEPSGTAIASLIGEETTDTVNLDDLGASYVIEYTVLQWYLEINPTSGAVTRTIRGAYCETFTFLTVENRLPLKKWTVTEGIKRLLQLAVPIRKGDYPMFVLEGDNGDGQPYTGQAAQFDTIPLPEIAMTKQTLRAVHGLSLVRLRRSASPRSLTLQRLTGRLRSRRTTKRSRSPCSNGAWAIFPAQTGGGHGDKQQDIRLH